MISFRKSLPYLTLAILMLALSCHEKDPAPDCGCEGKSQKQIKNQEAAYTGFGRFTFYETGDTSSAAYVAVACEIDSTWEKSENFKVSNYIVNGDIKWECFSGPTFNSFAAVSPLIKITSIRKK